MSSVPVAACLVGREANISSGGLLNTSELGVGCDCDLGPVGMGTESLENKSLSTLFGLDLTGFGAKRSSRSSLSCLDPVLLVSTLVEPNRSSSMVTLTFLAAELPKIPVSFFISFSNLFIKFGSEAVGLESELVSRRDEERESILVASESD